MSAKRVFVMAALAVCLGACVDEPGGAEDGKEPATDETNQEVVYGIDNRQDVFAHSDLSLRRAARQSHVALMQSSMLDTSNPSNVTFLGPTLGTLRNLCTTERFTNDQSAGFCSGTLIDDDLVLTAGHCVNAATCATTNIVFNFYRLGPSQMKNVTTSDVFTCASVVVQDLTPAQDYAIIRLDRMATPKYAPAPVRQDRGELPVGRRLGMIGVPDGIPLKIDTGGTVQNSRADTLDFFTANTDSFGGNSGSGIYDMDSYTLAGILVRGEVDYRGTGIFGNGCKVVNTCPENTAGCRGEDVTYVSQALDDFCSSNTNPRLCDPRNSFTYSASNTNYATTNVTRHFVRLEPGQILSAGTCGIPGAWGTGDTFLRILGVDGSFQNLSDDAPGCGSLSRVTITAPPLVGGVYEIDAGCSGSSSCGGNVVYTIAGPSGGSFSYNAQFTNNAQTNTTNFDVPMIAGQTITLGTCNSGMGRAQGTGDTFLRLFDPSGNQVGANDDFCGTQSKLSVTAAQTGVFQIRAGCFASNTCGGIVAYTLSNQGLFNYQAVNTSSAQVNTTNVFIPLATGQTINLGTCGFPGATAVGDTFLRLFDPFGNQVALNDDACGGVGSNLSFTATTPGSYQLRAGCFSGSACSGTIFWLTSRNDGGGSYAFTASNTASATQNTIDQPLSLLAGQTIRFGTCGLAGSSGTGDTFVRLMGPNSEQVTFNDDACGVLSNASFVVPAGSEGSYLIRAGCFSGNSCSGGLAFTVE
jgi:trypsin-like peptidase